MENPDKKKGAESRTRHPLIFESPTTVDYLSAQHGLEQSSPQAFLAAAAAAGQPPQSAADLEQVVAALQPGSAVALTGAKLLQPARAKLPNTTKASANLRMMRSFQSDH